MKPQYKQDEQRLRNAILEEDGQVNFGVVDEHGFAPLLAVIVKGPYPIEADPNRPGDPAKAWRQQ